MCACMYMYVRAYNGVKRADGCANSQFYTPDWQVEYSISSLSFRGNTVTVGISRERTIGCGCPTIMSLRGATTVATWQSSGANCA